MSKRSQIVVRIRILGKASKQRHNKHCSHTPAQYRIGIVSLGTCLDRSWCLTNIWRSGGKGKDCCVIEYLHTCHFSSIDVMFADTLFQNFLGASANATGCGDYKTCSPCVHSTDYDCSWCTTDKICIPKGHRSGTCSTELFGTCDDAYYTIVFLVVLGTLLCVCCLVCYMRRRGNPDGNMSNIFSPLLSQRARHALFRNSLIEGNELEWMCVICGFDNKPRSKDCTMCGTSHQFSLDYKTEKKAQREQRRKMKAISGLNAKRDTERSRVSTGAAAAPKSPRASRNKVVSAMHSDANHEANEDYNQLLESSSAEDEKSDRPIDIPIPQDAQITSISMSLRNFEMQNGQQTASANATTNVLTHQERQEAINYRRINQLTLRQKSARRRKMWQRVCDQASGGMLWMRVPVRETKVGSAPFGYTPRPSFSESRKGSLMSALSSFNFSQSSQSSQIGDADPHGVLEDLLSAAHAGPQSMSPPPYHIHRTNNAQDDNEDAYSNHELDIERAQRQLNPHMRTSAAASLSSPQHPRRALAAPSTPQSSARKAATTANSHKTVSSPIKINESRSTFASIFGLRSAQKAQQAAHLESQRRWSKDSFDSAVASGSPGFTSVFDEEGGLQWRRVDAGAPVIVPRYANSVAQFPRITEPQTSMALNNPVQNNHSNNNNNVQSHVRPPVPFDLPTIAAYTFKEKQIWFLDRLSELQKPWTEGFVRMEVRRAKLLDDSHRAWLQLRDVDLHKWFRFQFSNEPGIDAGGLEREWFALIMDEIFAAQAGFFLPCGASGGDSNNSGVYHINPISGAINPNHLSFFRFIGRVFGKALMGQQSIKANLALPLRKQIIGIPVTFSDLEFVDDVLYRNLKWLKRQAEDGEHEMIESMMLDFSISYTAASQTVTYDLKEDGSNIPVTAENLDEYLQLRLRHRLLDSVKCQLENLLLGFYEVIPPELLSVFDYQELDLLLCGVPELDLEDWMRHTEYMGEYRRLGGKHHIIRWFWRSVEAMSNEDRVRLLQFTTGCARLPVQGFKALQSSDGRYRKFNLQSISKAVGSCTNLVYCSVFC